MQRGFSIFLLPLLSGSEPMSFHRTALPCSSGRMFWHRTLSIRRRPMSACARRLLRTTHGILRGHSLSRRLGTCVSTLRRAASLRRWILGKCSARIRSWRIVRWCRDFRVPCSSNLTMRCPIWQGTRPYIFQTGFLRSSRVRRERGCGLCITLLRGQLRALC